MASNNIETLSSAIHENKAVQFVMCEYQLDKSLRAVSDYVVVKPVRMVPYNGFYYLIAFDPETDALQHYRIDKIKDVKVTEDFIDYDAINSKLFIDEYLASHSLMQSGNAVQVKIKIPESQIGLVIDQFGDKFRISEVTDEVATVSLSSNENDLYLWALEHGDFVEVLEPQSVRNKIRITVAQMHQKYSCKELDKYDIELIKAQRPILHNQHWFGCPNVKLDQKHEWKELTQLTDLSFNNNRVTDFSFTNTLTNLRKISFENERVDDLSFLFRLPKLTTLWLKETTVSDISSFSDLKLGRLGLVRNYDLKDYSVLMKMKTLRYLYVDSETLEKIDIAELKKVNSKLTIWLEPEKGKVIKL